MAIRQCSAAHCSIADPEIYAVCVQNGLPAGYPVLTKDPNGPCTCSCSCLAFGTPVQIGNNDFEVIEKIETGSKVLAAGLDLQWSEHVVEFSQGTAGSSTQPYTVLITYEDRFLAVTSDHVFLLADKSLKRADRLIVGDELTSPDGSPIPVRSVHIGEYTAGFHHIATRKALPDEQLSGHLLNTNGVVSADYVVQISYASGERRSQFIANHDELPVVGSPEYVAAYGDDCLNAPANIAGLTLPSFIARDMPDSGQPAFVAANNIRLSIPVDAHGFVSNEEAERLAQDPKRAWNDPAAKAWTEYLLSHYKIFFPEVTYHFDWADNTVNAYAWVQNGVRNVAILGGLVRHMALELEGVSIVTAHELAHHYGGPPTHPGSLSCEGQSDYYGVRTIMRRAWFGQYYLDMTDRGIAQMAGFFGVANSPTAPGGNAGCTHPAGACRIATYHAAVSLTGKPGCAG